MPVRTRSAAAIAALLVAGCATTTAFQKSVAHVGPLLAADAAAYAKADATLAPDVAAARAAEAADLATATGTAGDVTAQSTSTAWAAVRPWYVQYLAADASRTPSERKVDAARVAAFDRSIAAEAGRPLGAGTRPTGS